MANQGAPIDPDTVKRLFLPFVRGADQSGSQGLGLGLYIASEIARAHGGALEAVFDRRGDTLHIPDEPPAPPT